jgi:hypothetical protein
MFTGAHHWSLSLARCIQFTPFHPISLRFTLILSSYLCLGLLSGLFPSDITTKILYAFLISPMHATYPVHLILLDHHPVTSINRIYSLQLGRLILIWVLRSQNILNYTDKSLRKRRVTLKTEDCYFSWSAMWCPKMNPRHQQQCIRLVELWKLSVFPAKNLHVMIILDTSRIVGVPHLEYEQYWIMSSWFNKGTTQFVNSEKCLCLWMEIIDTYINFVVTLPSSNSQHRFTILNSQTCHHFLPQN